MQNMENGPRVSAESEKDRALRYFTGELYNNTPEKHHHRLPAVATAVFQYYVSRLGSFGHHCHVEAMRMAVAVLNGEREMPEVPAETVNTTRKEVSAQVEKTVESQDASAVENTAPAEENSSAARRHPGPLPEVHLNTDTRELAGRFYTPEDLREHNPFNGVGGLENMGAFDPDRVPPASEKTVEDFNVTLQRMVAEGADEEDVNAVVVRAVTKGVNVREVMAALQNAYNNSDSTRASG